MVRSELQGEFRRMDLASKAPHQLLTEARAGGLAVFARGDQLIVRGPRMPNRIWCRRCCAEKPS